MYHFVAMSIILNEFEARVLGALIEKEITTPDYYPISLNALVNACNQKSNRDPLMTLDEDSVREALRSLNQKELAGPADTFDSRVAKYEHRMQEAFNFTRSETAILCELLLRGPQTPGELRSRTERMHHFDDLRQVQSALQLLMKREPPLAMVLPRQPGAKEARYTHLLSGDVKRDETVLSGPVTAPTGGSNSPTNTERIALLENEVSEFKKEIAELKAQLANFRKQFD
jgi:uncharacterized protein YceH (UPF0502 family)